MRDILMKYHCWRNFVEDVTIQCKLLAVIMRYLVAIKLMNVVECRFQFSVALAAVALKIYLFVSSITTLLLLSLFCRT